MGHVPKYPRIQHRIHHHRRAHSVTFAIMLNEVTKKFVAKAYQTMMFFPCFLSWVVVSYFLNAFLDAQYGMIPMAQQAAGQDVISWYTNTKPWPYIIVLANLWKNVGYSTVLYLAAITGIDSTQYEAAAIDGATKWQQIIYVTLPHLKAMIFGGLVPTYIVCTQVLGLNENYAALIVLLVNPFNIIIMRTFFKSSCPMELIEAATIDGSGEYSTLFRIVAPIAKPGVATIALLNALAFWNEWYLSLLYIKRNKILQPLQALLMELQNNVQYLNQMAGQLGAARICTRSAHHHPRGHLGLCKDQRL